jgi:hypothetical protein
MGSNSGILDGNGVKATQGINTPNLLLPRCCVGKLKNKIKSYFDIALHLKITNDDKKERYLITSNAISPLAKDRSGKLNEMETADLTAIINKIGG